MNSKKLKGVINMLRDGLCSSVKHVADELSISRVSASRMIDLLEDRGIAVKRENSRGYVLSPDIAAFILRVHKESCGIVVARLDGNVLLREKFDFLYSLSPAENVTSFCATAKRYASSLQKRYEVIVPCCIYDSSALSVGAVLPAEYEKRMMRSELVSAAIGELCPEKMVLYVAARDGECFLTLCFGGAPVGDGKAFDFDIESKDKVFDHIASMLEILTPDAIFVDGECDLSIADLTDGKRIALIKHGLQNGIMLDEKEIISRICFDMMNQK